MKTFFVSLLFIAGFALSVATAPRQTQQHASPTPDAATTAATTTTTTTTDDVAAEEEVVKRGDPLGDSPEVAFADVLKAPEKYTSKPVIVEGVIERVCTNKGCWMEIAPKAGDAGARVTFKDYGFFVPTSSRGWWVKAEGQFAVKTLSKEKAEHYETEGARVKRNADGTVTEISFVASGVELRKAQK